jgi:hypothetical protein
MGLEVVADALDTFIVLNGKWPEGLGQLSPRDRTALVLRALEYARVGPEGTSETSAEKPIPGLGLYQDRDGLLLDTWKTPCCIFLQTEVQALRPPDGKPHRSDFLFCSAGPDRVFNGGRGDDICVEYSVPE